MKDNEFDIMGVVTCVVFILMAFFLIFLGIGRMPYADGSGENILIFVGLFIFCVCAWGLLSLKNTIVNFILIAYFIASTVFFVTSIDKIQLWSLKNGYSSINKEMIKSYENITETAMYKEFLINKENNNVEKYKLYRNHINDYISIDSKKVMELKLFYSSIQNKDITKKLDEIFQDDLVTITEYDEFKSFIYKVKLTSKESSLISIIQK